MKVLMNIIKSRENVFVLLIILTSIYFSISYSFEQDAIDGALAYGGFVEFPEGFSVMKAYYLNQWTLLHQLPALFLKLNFSIIDTCRIILFFSTFFYITGIYLVAKSISSSSVLSFFIAITVIMFRKNFGDVGYPTSIFSAHSYGMMSLAIVTFIFGLIGNKNYFASGFFSVLLFCIHPVMGLWIIGIFIISFLLIKYLKNNFTIGKNILNGSVVGLFPVLFSFVFFYFNITEEITTDFDKESYQTYIDLWDSHRTNWGNLNILNYNYLFKSSILIFLLFIYLYFYSNKKFGGPFLMTCVILVSCFTSIFIYISYKLFPNIFPDIIKNIIPSRFVLSYSVIGWPIIISISFLLVKSLLNSFRINPNYAFVFVMLLLTLYSLSHYKNVLIRTENFVTNFNADNRKYENDVFWNNVQKIKMRGFVLTSISPRYYYIYRHINKPLLLNLEIINVIPYIPNIAGDIKNIIEKIYGVNFNIPPIKFVPCIPEKIIKNNFENRTYNEWKNLSDEFNFNWIIIPTDWKISVKPEFQNNNYAFYDINDLHNISPSESWIINEKKRLKIKSVINNCYPH